MALSQHGTLAPTVIHQRTAYAASMIDGRTVMELPGEEHRVIHVVFDPDGSKLASVGEDGLVHVWALELDDLTAKATERLTPAR